jgi:hypothetical protein
MPVQKGTVSPDLGGVIFIDESPVLAFRDHDLAARPVAAIQNQKLRRKV